MTLGHTYFYVRFFVYFKLSSGDYAWVRSYKWQVHCFPAKIKSCSDVWKSGYDLEVIWNYLVRKKSCSDLLKSGYDFRDAPAKSDVNEAIVLRSLASEYDFDVSDNFLIKAKCFLEAGVQNFGAEHLRLRWETIKPHCRLSNSCNESILYFSYLCFSHE